MAWEIVDGGSKGIRVVFADKTFLDFPNMDAQVLASNEPKWSGDLVIGDWTGINDAWIAVANFRKDSYSYVMQIP